MHSNDFDIIQPIKYNSQSLYYLKADFLYVSINHIIGILLAFEGLDTLGRFSAHNVCDFWFALLPLLNKRGGKVFPFRHHENTPI